MKFIKFEFGDGSYELIKLKSIEGVQIREKTITILVTSGKDYYYTKGSEMRNYIKNFDEVKELLLKMSEN
jgi:hypothetical protein|nr:MAG TPA: hypothetical protein [Caudoviricetes sp.]DAS43895.1 MAG TPA: hypothetical protein [Caudoviricetes sp.]DAT80033.1 MAG TPA: hypothetical protein [Caudoviricetes sp.]